MPRKKVINDENTSTLKSKKRNIAVNSNISDLVKEELVKEEVEEVVKEEVEEVVKEEVVKEEVEEVVKEEVVEEVVKEEVEEEVKEEVVKEVVEEVVKEEVVKEEVVKEEVVVNKLSLEECFEDKLIAIPKISNEEKLLKKTKKKNEKTIKKSDNLLINDNNDYNISKVQSVDEENDYLIKLNRTISYKKLEEKLKNSKVELLESKEFTMENNEVDNILNENIEIEVLDKGINYSLVDLNNIFNKIINACMIIDIKDGYIKYIEKKGNESRNQSVIDLLKKTNNYKKIPDVQFIIFTNDFMENLELTNNSYLLTFCKNNLYKNNYFPNFNFNHWLEAGIGSYEDEYNYFINNQINWNTKLDSVFWSGANTNIIRKKIYDSSKKYKNYDINLLNKNRDNNIPLRNIVKSKYLLNMNGYSYGGRLNYLFMSGSCVIILKNINSKKCYSEFFYEYFIENVDYISVEYSDNENGEIIIEKINNAIKNNNCELIASSCYSKAKNIFKMNNIYDYIHGTLNNLSKNNIITNRLENSLFFIPPLNYYFKDRLLIKDNIINFSFRGNDFDMNIYDNSSVINIKIKNNITKIFCNELFVYEKYTPYILNNNKIQKYIIIIENGMLSITLNDKFKLINALLGLDNFNGISVDIKSDSECLFVN